MPNIIKNMKASNRSSLLQIFIAARIRLQITFFPFVLTAASLLHPSISSAQIVPTDSILALHIQEALKNNPDLASWRHRVEAANERIPQAGAWPDPMLGLSVMSLPVNTFSLNEEDMTGIWVNLSQQIPLGGKPSVRKAIARHSLRALQNGEEARRFSIAVAVAQAWYDWRYLEQAIRTLDAQIRVLDDLIAAALKMYETGMGKQQDVLKAQTERSMLLDHRAELEQMALSQGRRFAVLLGREPDDAPEAPQPASVEFSQLDREELLHRLSKSNPVLKKASADVDEARSKTTLMRREWWPEFNVGVGYGYRQDSPEGMERPDFLSAMVEISLPVFGAWKQGPAVQEMEAMARQMSSEQRTMELDLSYELNSMLDEDTRLAKQIELFREGILPQAEATLGASMAEYSVGKVDFEALLMAENAVYSARLELDARIRDRHKVRAAIGGLVTDQVLSAYPEQP